MKKRVLSVVVLLSILVSCGTSPQEPVETAADKTPDAAVATQEETVPETNAPEEPVLPDVPERDYKEGNPTGFQILWP